MKLSELEHGEFVEIDLTTLLQDDERFRAKVNGEKHGWITIWHATFGDCVVPDEGSHFKSFIFVQNYI